MARCSAVLLHGNLLGGLPLRHSPTWVACEAAHNRVRSLCAGGMPFGNPLYGSAPGSTPLRQSYDPDINPVWSPHGEVVPASGHRALLLLPPPPAEQLPAPAPPSGADALHKPSLLLSTLRTSAPTLSSLSSLIQLEAGLLAKPLQPDEQLPAPAPPGVRAPCVNIAFEQLSLLGENKQAGLPSD